MATFSTNQNRQLYVVNAYSETVNDESAVGTLGGVKAISNGNSKEFYFTYKGVDGLMQSDRIQLKNLSHVKAISAPALAIKLDDYMVSLDLEVNGGNPVPGQDYVLGINFRQWAGAGEIHQYYKDAVVHATTGMTAAQFYSKMVDSLNASFSRELGATKTSNPYLKFIASGGGIIIQEKEQPWTLGVESQERVYFDVLPSTIFVDNSDVIWGRVSKSSEGNPINNGKKIADLEYFCMGERGDQYRNVGWPNVITTQYLVDPSKAYNVLEIHHAYTDEGVNSYRSEKDITIVTTNPTTINSIVSAINTVAGTNFVGLSTGDSAGAD